jgi:hypothetical protein
MPSDPTEIKYQRPRYTVERSISVRITRRFSAQFVLWECFVA